MIHELEPGVFDLYCNSKIISVKLDGFNGEQKGILARALELLEPLFPAWLHQLTLRQIENDHPDNASILMDVSTDAPYRFASINVYPRAWKYDSVKEFAKNLLHEIVHIWLAPYCRFTDSLLDNCFARLDYAPSQIIRDAHRDQLESLVTDLEIMLSRITAEMDRLEGRNKQAAQEMNQE